MAHVGDVTVGLKAETTDFQLKMAGATARLREFKTAGESTGDALGDLKAQFRTTQASIDGLKTKVAQTQTETKKMSSAFAGLASVGVLIGVQALVTVVTRLAARAREAAEELRKAHIEAFRLWIAQKNIGLTNAPEPRPSLGTLGGIERGLRERAAALSELLAGLARSGGQGGEVWLRTMQELAQINETLRDVEATRRAIGEDIAEAAEREAEAARKAKDARFKQLQAMYGLSGMQPAVAAMGGVPNLEPRLAGGNRAMTTLVNNLEILTTKTRNAEAAFTPFDLSLRQTGMDASHLSALLLEMQRRAEALGIDLKNAKTDTEVFNQTIQDTISALYTLRNAIDRLRSGNILGFFGMLAGAAVGFGLGGAAGALVGAQVGGTIFGQPSMQLNMSVNVGRPQNPMALARDREWQAALRESLLVAQAQGFRLVGA